MTDMTIAVDPMTVAGEALELLPKGGFLTVKHKNRLNTMTIGWGSLGVIWSRPIFMAAVRKSRYTYNLIERAGEFTVSLPPVVVARKELGYCGTRSGRDVDKFAESGLGTIGGQKVATPVVDLPGLHFECKTLLRSPMDADMMDPSLLDSYPGGDLHTFYFGEILAAYRVPLPEPEDG